MDKKRRCSWSTNTMLEQQYHDAEWGVPVHEDRRHFEMITLEGAQAGLSWHTILKKREGYQEAFHQFDVAKVAVMTELDVERLVKMPAIVRHRGKIQSVIHNAKCFQEIQNTQGSFDEYIWRFVDRKVLKNSWKNAQDVPSSTPLSDKISKDLKKRGFKFVGSTTIYAYLQAAGLVNDHCVSCFRYLEVDK